MQRLGLDTPKNTADLVADSLRSAILQGKFKAGESLKQDEIANELKVSKIPVREALIQLQAEGLVMMRQNRGAVVSTLSLSEIEQIYIMRRALEDIALTRAIPRTTEQDLAEMEHILNQIELETDLTRWVELNWQFHEALYRPADMPLMQKHIREMHNNVARFLAVYHLDQVVLAASQQQHRDILEAVRAGDSKTARDLLKQHLTEPMYLFRDVLED